MCSNDCYTDFLNTPSIVDVKLGPGFHVFAFCTCLNIICAAIHMLTPVPEEALESCTGETKPAIETASEMGAPTDDAHDVPTGLVSETV